MLYFLQVMLGIPLLEGSNPASCFPRLVVGYEATCYSHMWSEVSQKIIFCDIFHLLLAALLTISIDIHVGSLGFCC